MDAPHFPIQSMAQLLVDEEICRRTGWTAGWPIRLADGIVWHLPQIESSLLVANPRLIDDLCKAFDLAGKTIDVWADLELQTMASALYHAQLAQLAVVLLQTNYDQPEARWRRLLAFGELDLMLRMTHEVAQAVGESADVWMPFYRTRGREGQTCLESN